MFGVRSGVSICGCGSFGEEFDLFDGRIGGEVFYWRFLEERIRELRFEI